MTGIQWTDETWNPVTGCNKVSAGCAHCYAEGIAKRFWGDRKFSDVQFHLERLEQPFRWRKPRMVFVNSMSDLFHESVTDDQLDQIFAVMALTPQHVYQVLTKRPKRMLEYMDGLTNAQGGFRFAAEIIRSKWIVPSDLTDSRAWKLSESLHNDGGSCLPLQNVWMGVSVENQKAADDRIPLLLQTPAAVRFLSCEPLLESVSLQLIPDGKNCIGCGDGDHQLFECHHVLSNFPGWVIAGGESGPKARPCDVNWLRSIVAQCKAAKVPCFVKQLGSKPQGLWVSRGENLAVTGKGGDPSEWPEDLRVREFPSDV